jgi:hypothetical protein
MDLDSKGLTITGKFIKTARMAEEWYKDIDDPAFFIKNLKNSNARADILTFWQRLPETKPKYNYYMELDSIAALRVTTYSNWFEKQIDSKTRNVIRKAGKKGVEIKKTEFNDDFVNGVVEIFNESPVRQGKPFWHYGMDANALRQFLTPNIYHEDIVGAHSNNELIGFITIAYTQEYAMLTQILSKIAHRDKAPNNALVAKAVEICEAKKMPYLCYAYWPKGSLADFKQNNAFEEIQLPRYYVPLSIKGHITLKLRLHNGIKGILPESTVNRLLNLRNKWYSRKT